VVDIEGGRLRTATMTQAKNGDGFTPIGPWIDSAIDPADLPMTFHVNGDTSPSQTPDLALHVTNQLPHQITDPGGPGDVALTGCPGTFAPSNPSASAGFPLTGSAS